MAFRVKQGSEQGRTVYVDGQKFLTRAAAETHAATIRADWQPVVVETDEVILPITAESQLTKGQKKRFSPKRINYGGEAATISVQVRYDDECGNGHNTFAITADIYAVDRRRNPHDGGMLACGCMHEEVAKHFPQLAKYIKWHLCSSDGPSSYLANALFLAGERDCWGRLAGEPSAWQTAVQFSGCPVKWRGHNKDAFVKWLRTAEGCDFEVLRIDHGGTEADNKLYGPKYTLGGAPDKWYQCPFDTEQEALDFLAAMRLGYKVVEIPTAYSTGKARELEAARRAAVWPEATDEELCTPDLKERLIARLPGLLAEFRQDVEALGFIW